MRGRPSSMPTRNARTRVRRAETADWLEVDPARPADLGQNHPSYHPVAKQNPPHVTAGQVLTCLVAAYAGATAL